MFTRIIDKLAGDYNAKQIKKIQPLVDQINQLYESRHDLSDDQIQSKTQQFKDRLQAGETLDELLPEAFATVKQACRRMCGQEFDVKGTKLTWNMIPYDVQLIWGIIIHRGTMAEMRTWEWKTLVATLPSYLNALTGKGVHVVTVNDYLASRDAEWMGHLYRRLWLTVWSVVKWVPLTIRRQQYEADITYVENSELGFDYLRDNLAKSLDDRNMMWRPLHYAIVDEVDSILIDEARTPLIISQPSNEPTQKYWYYAQIVKLLTPSKNKKKISKWFLAELMKDEKEEEIEDDGGDYYIDEKTKSVTLSSTGIAKLEKMLNVEHLYKDLWYGEIHHIENALKAQAVYHNNKEYLVRDGQVMIVDDHTGRVMPGRRFSQWLHQAIEAKENVTIQKESRTLASITYQNFFKQYEKLAGMTGTALTEAEEFEKIYETETVTIPTNKPVIRVDKKDQVYFNQDAKRRAIVDHIKFYHDVWVPILIGTSSIQTSELVSNILNKSALQHFVLNAKFHEQEANIVKNAGTQGSIVVATNMAWRGTDIKLDPDLNTHIAKQYAQHISNQMSEVASFQAIIYSEVEYEIFVQAIRQQFDIPRDEQSQSTIKTDTVSIQISHNSSKKTSEDVYATITFRPVAQTISTETTTRDIHFWLLILGTEKHESRRIDNQLRGRAGRQGDPWMSVFFVALDDEIMRKMWGNKIQGIARMMLNKEELESMAFTQKQFTNSIQRAQKQMEWRHFGIRKHLFDYDSVINKQRMRIYTRRDQILQVDDASVDSTTHSDTTDTPSDTTNTTDPTIVELTILDETKESLIKIVRRAVATYATYKPRNIPELVESIEQITTVAFEEQEIAQQSSSRTLETFLIEQLQQAFELKFQDVDHDRALTYVRKIALGVIDKYRVEHIDEMSYLREKVSLRSYAQQDPLVIYKKEAYEKFQTLLSTIETETVAQIMRTNFKELQWWDQLAEQIANANGEEDMLEILKEVAGEVDIGTLNSLQQKAQASWNSAVAKEIQQTKEIKKQQISLVSGESATVLEQDDEFEVLEIEEPTVSSKGSWGSASAWDSTDTIIRPATKKLRPNDKVTIKHPDGRIEYSVKWKKIKDRVESGEVKVVQ